MGLEEMRKEPKKGSGRLTDNVMKDTQIDNKSPRAKDGVHRFNLLKESVIGRILFKPSVDNFLLCKK